MVRITLFAFSVLAASLGQPALAHSIESGQTPREEARLACGYAEGDEVIFIDAERIGTASQLAQALEGSSNFLPIVLGGSFVGENFRPYAGAFDRVCFYDTDLSKSHWSQLHNGQFVNSSLASAELRGARMDSVRFMGANLKNTDFSDAVLIGGKIEGRYSRTNLQYANFSGADMRGFRFKCGITMYDTCGWANSANYAGANLGGADLVTLPIWPGDNFAGAVFSNTRISPRAVPHLDDVIVKDAELSQPAIILAASEGQEETVTANLTASDFFELQRQSLTATVDAPAFDCAKASVPSEKMICSEYETALRDLDRVMAQVFAEARAKRATTRKAQGIWLRKRNACGESRSCLTEAYQARLGQLFAALNSPLIMAPDESRSFHENILPVPDAFKSTELYSRVAPVLVDASRQSVTLTGMEDGSISAEGEAIGANAHLCAMNAFDAQYDPASGWHSAVSESGAKVPLFRVWQNRLMIRYSGNSGDTPPEVQPYITCGARAGFTDLFDISATAR